MSNQTVREAAYAVLDSWGKQFGCLEKDMQKLESALAQPDPEPTLCGMDEETLQSFICKVKGACEYARDGLRTASMVDLNHAIALLPVERKTWTVPGLDNVPPPHEWPQGIVRETRESSGGLWIHWALNGYYVDPGAKIDITDPDNPFIVGDES